MQNLKSAMMIFSVLLIFSHVTAQQEAPFVKVRDLQFTVDGQPYFFLGTNLWYGANLGAKSEGGNQERLIKELDLLQSLGINNLRILGASEGQSPHKIVQPPIQPQLGRYDQRLLEGMDFLLDEMGKRDMYAVVYLNNYWEWSGGMAQYVSWTENIPIPNPNLQPFDWDKFMNYSASFYGNEEANKAFHTYIKMLLNRKNSINGKIYKDDPVIMSWQLANEPRPGRGEEGKKNIEAFKRWINQTAKYIKSLDGNHLISAGNEGLIGSFESAELFKEIHNYASIDYATFHLWLLNWSWYDPVKAEETYPSAKQKALNYIDQHILFAREFAKPIVLEEFGIPRDGHSYSPEATTDWRDQYFSTVYERIFEDAAGGGPLVGSNFWAWGGFAKASPTDKAEWNEGDDFMGDPPQEPQGRNSVFASDTSTLDILKVFAAKMHSLGN